MVVAGMVILLVGLSLPILMLVLALLVDAGILLWAAYTELRSGFTGIGVHITERIGRPVVRLGGTHHAVIQPVSR